MPVRHCHQPPVLVGGRHARQGTKGRRVVIHGSTPDIQTQRVNADRLAGGTADDMQIRWHIVEGIASVQRPGVIQIMVTGKYDCGNFQAAHFGDEKFQQRVWNARVVKNIPGN